MRKAKAEKDNKKLARALKAHKAKSMEEKSNVVERMRVVFEREREVAVSDATIALKGDLRKCNRGVECLKHTLWKSEVNCFEITFIVRSPGLFYLISASHCVGRFTTIF